MHPITYGETHRKTSVFDKEHFFDFFEKNSELYKNLSLNEDCLYRENVIIDNPVLNYLNHINDKSVDETLKTLIRVEFEKLEKIYPKLGSIFVHYFLSGQEIEHNNTFFKLRKDNIESFIETLKFETTKSLISEIVNNVNLEYLITVDSTVSKEITCKKTKMINFDIDYDYSFLGTKKFHTMENFKFVVIDGFIQSVSEIHHLLHNASVDKVPHVIFCFGVSPEVKHVILENNKKLITEVFPVCFNVEEETINILNDIAFSLSSDVVSAKKGQTISQAVRNDLKTGRKITFNKKGFTLLPSVSDYEVQKHRAFLQGRIDYATNEKNKSLLVKRLKRFSNKTFHIFIPRHHMENSNFIRDLDYGIRFLSNSKKNMKKVKMGKAFIYVPEAYLNIVDSVMKSLKEKYDSISKVIVLKG